MQRIWKISWLTAVTTLIITIGCTSTQAEPESAAIELELDTETISSVRISPTAVPTIEPTTAAQATAVPPIEVDLPDMGEAPEIHNEVWVNSPTPATLADARGKVVLLEFWTFG